MWPSARARPWRAAQWSGTAPIGPAMTTMRSVIAYLAAMIRCAGMVYIVVEVATWHRFYTAAAWRLTAPALTVAWAAVVVIVLLRRRWPAPFFACVDSAVYLTVAVS